MYCAEEEMFRLFLLFHFNLFSAMSVYYLLILILQVILLRRMICRKLGIVVHPSFPIHPLGLVGSLWGLLVAFGLVRGGCGVSVCLGGLAGLGFRCLIAFHHLCCENFPAAVRLVVRLKSVIYV